MSEREQQKTETGDIETVRAALVRVGDETPVGTVEAVEFFGDLRLIDMVIDGTVYSRGFDALVDRAVRR